MSLVAYVTAAESDVYLAAYQDWLDLDDATKDGHLVWGRRWIDSKYTCLDYDETNATDEIKHANSILGYEDFKGRLFSTGGSDGGAVLKEKSVAGSVSYEVEYASGVTGSNPAFDQVDILLEGDCTKNAGHDGTVGLSRN